MARRNPLNPLSLLFVLCVLVYSFYSDYVGTPSNRGSTRSDGSSQGNDAATGPEGGTGQAGSDAAERALVTRLMGQVVSGRVGRIVDGDTLDLQIDPRPFLAASNPATAERGAADLPPGLTVRLRLEGIDAPETAQPFGASAADYLRQMCEGQVVFAVFLEQDRFGRVVGDLYREDLWINGQMVRAGMAWHDPRFDSHPELASLQQVARSERRGLWQEGSSIPPWQYRRQLEPSSSAP